MFFGCLFHSLIDEVVERTVAQGIWVIDHNDERCCAGRIIRILNIDGITVLATRQACQQEKQDEI